MAWRVLQGDLEIGRAMRDTRLGPIGGGTDEVMKEILGEAAGALVGPAPVLVEVGAGLLLPVALLVALRRRSGRAR